MLLAPNLVGCSQRLCGSQERILLVPDVCYPSDAQVDLQRRNLDGSRHVEAAEGGDDGIGDGHVLGLASRERLLPAPGDFALPPCVTNGSGLSDRVKRQGSGRRAQQLNCRDRSVNVTDCSRA